VRKIFLLVVVVLATTVSAGKKEVSTARKASTLIKTIQKYHYKPRPVDDSLSSLIFDQFLKALDPYGCFFTKEIVKDLEHYR
jgi:carboxyl-terminal processing protease